MSELQSSHFSDSVGAASEAVPHSMTVSLAGELGREDISDVLLMFAGAVPFQTNNVVLDFSPVTHIDFRSLGLLAQLSSTLKQRGGTLVLCGLSLYLKTIFRTVNLLAAFDVFESRHQAEASFARI
jgi:anti-anti-sigma factor